MAYPGREGAHSAAACERLFPRAELLPLPSFAAVLDAVEGADAEYGVLPIENSLAGAVNETHDLLFASSVSIVAQTVLPIRHLLVGPSPVSLVDVRVVHSHPTALDQCRSLLAQMPDAMAVAATTTADAARHVAELHDPRQVAIASERAAARFALEILARDVGDHPETYTRFVALACHTRLDRDGRPFRTAFSFVTDHRAGALNRAVEPFARHGIDLVQLVSRPIPETPWRYRFDAVLEGHPLDEQVRAALSEARDRTRLLRLLGSYPA